ncbi:transcription termination factor 2 [Coccidioides immitis RS]|uniref:Transcription termination factor 2 n=1 Tax=Coccidioides immitis (strain RS) TaxID=246410 RepID=A0A0D8JUB5_COCIM|nr:transcription termination factor 2 [Coccidioides immitis RS]KJF60704.1 transcription termination factor 2 [Coccidioides immitis RS]
MNETHVKAMLGLTVKKLLDLKKIMQELYNKKIQSLLHQQQDSAGLKESSTRKQDNSNIIFSKIHFSSLFGQVSDAGGQRTLLSHYLYQKHDLWLYIIKSLNKQVTIINKQL